VGRDVKQPQLCSNCGSASAPSQHFCSTCGQQLTRLGASAPQHAGTYSWRAAEDYRQLAIGLPNPAKSPGWFSFHGRIGRAGFWGRWVGLLIGLFIGEFVTVLLLAWIPSPGGIRAMAGFESLIFVMALWFAASMSALRLRDMGASPYLTLIGFVPGMNFLLLLSLMFIPGAGQASKRAFR
jgi:uncharacterized membrane protein YhaH (DUF805 family)